MNMSRNTAMIITGATALVCGCPGLFSCLFGVIGAAASQMPNADIDVFGSSDPGSALMLGLGSVCVGIILVAIPVAVGFFLLRRPQTGTTTLPQ